MTRKHPVTTTHAYTVEDARRVLRDSPPRSGLSGGRS
jgi:hypothetical protein